MKTINISLGERSYPIYVGQNLFDQKELLCKHLPGKRVAIVTNKTVGKLYLEKICNLLDEKDLIKIILPDGEVFKNQESLTLIYDQLLKNNADRKTTLIALGGGVIGDITGFASATFMRGVDFIQIPTTLLSQVDSSVGGKTGINHSLGKNLIGAFKQPKCVLTDVSFLSTLPQNELSAGMAEVIKYGLIRDYKFFVWLEANIDGLIKKSPDLLMEAIIRSCQNKSEIVEADEFESGIRAILNLGHTFGHAIESAVGYGNWLHGEAVAAGTVMSVTLSLHMGWLTEKDVVRIVAILKKSGLPVNPPNISIEKFLDLMRRDKKTKNNDIYLVLLKKIGVSILTKDYDFEKLKQVLQKKTFD